MKNVLKKIAGILFILSLLYYVFWLVYAGITFFTGTEERLVFFGETPEELHGWDAFSETFSIGVLLTCIYFWFVPLYQALYLICVIVGKIVKSKKKKAADAFADTDSAQN